MLFIVTVLAGFAALALAMTAGYYLGWRAASAPSTWKKRTSRVALSRRAVNLLVLVAVRRARQRLRAEPVVELLALRLLVPRRPGLVRPR